MIKNHRDLYGELAIAGDDSSIYLRDDEFFYLGEEEKRCIRGKLHDLTRVTLLECVGGDVPGETSRLDEASGQWETFHHQTLFPHFVVEGPRHLDPRHACIDEIAFVMDDGAVLFRDRRAFGVVFDAPGLIRRITRADKRARGRARIGDRPQIAYFAGECEIVCVKTAIGRIAARHNPSQQLLGSTAGVRVDNFVSISIQPTGPIDFDEAIRRVSKVLRFLEILVGRPQNIVSLYIRNAPIDSQDPYLKVSWSHAPGRNWSANMERQSRPAGSHLLIDPVLDPKEFAKVTAAWFVNDEERDLARARLSTFFTMGRLITIDRLIGAANMFEHLPDTAAPRKATVTVELDRKRKQCEGIIKPLPPSEARDGVLMALSRIGKATLKQRIKHRAGLIERKLREKRLPDLRGVIDEAVNCRNFFVHGGKPRFAYADNMALVAFFSQTLEFVFAASELIEAGWNIQKWIRRGAGGHPFGLFAQSYAWHLRELRALLPPKPRGE